MVQRDGDRVASAGQVEIIVLPSGTLDGPACPFQPAWMPHTEPSVDRVVTDTPTSGTGWSPGRRAGSAPSTEFAAEARMVRLTVAPALFLMLIVVKFRNRSNPETSPWGSVPGSLPFLNHDCRATIGSAYRLAGQTGSRRGAFPRSDSPPPHQVKVQVVECRRRRIVAP